MMREILFRGKDYKGNWVEGYVVELFGKSKPIYCIDTCKRFDVDGDSIDIYKVIPETIGQFTGLLDKNGNKIFEGDVYIYKDYSNGAVISLTSKNSSQPTRTAVVEIDNMIVGMKRPYGATKFENGLELEIIGNIHDNPELLEDK